jgi:hypothetical protein
MEKEKKEEASKLKKNVDQKNILPLNSGEEQKFEKKEEDSELNKNIEKKKFLLNSEKEGNFVPKKEDVSEINEKIIFSTNIEPLLKNKSHHIR